MIDLVYVRENFDVNTRNEWAQTTYASKTSEDKDLWDGVDAWISCTDGYFECSDGNLTANGLSVIYGAYNNVDMNRVESAVQTLSGLLVGLPGTISAYLSANGVAPDAIFDVPYDPADYGSYTVKTDWARADIPDATNRARYIANVADIITALTASYPALPTQLAFLTVAGANNIEYALYLLSVAIDELEAQTKANIDHAAQSFFYSAEIYSGEV